MTENNPLAKFYRQPKAFVKLPSLAGTYVEEDVIKYEDGQVELAVRPLTAYDEIMLKNPDALLNGEAIINAIRSCVPSIQRPDKLLINDINFLLAVIKKISNDSHDTVLVCPIEECKHENKYSLNLEYIIDSVSFLDATYPVNLPMGLSVFVRPYTYELSLHRNTIAFEESRFFRILTDVADDEDEFDMSKLKKLSDIIKKASGINVDMVTDSILSIVSESENIDISDKKSIRDFITNITSTEAKLISKEIDRISTIGLPENVDAVCEECKHEWKAPLSFDPTSFFTDT